MLKDGNPAALEPFFKDFPEGAVALLPHYLERVQKANPGAFQDHIGPYAVDLMVQAGFEQALQSAANSADPKAGIQALLDWIGKQKGNVELRRQAPVRAPGQDRLTEQQKQLDTEREQLFSDRTKDFINAQVNPKLAAAVEDYAKRYKLNEQQKTDFDNRLRDQILSTMGNDPDYKNQLTIRKSAKDRTPERVAEYISGNFNGRIKDAAFAVWGKVGKSIYGVQTSTQNGTGQVRADQPQASPSGAPLFVSQRPPDSELNLNYPDAGEAEMNLIKGRGYTKAGNRFITWRK